jgi:FlaA1/EpsC-like NDP-sugar epimerase
LIRLHGLSPGEDMEIVYTGIRPGEKIFEEILTAEEGTTKTTHERIYVAIIPQRFSLDSINEGLKELRTLIETNPEQIKSHLNTLLNTRLVAEH